MEAIVMSACCISFGGIAISQMFFFAIFAIQMPPGVAIILFSASIAACFFHSFAESNDTSA